MSDQFFLPRDQQRLLRRTLATIPQLIEDLAVTITRQDRIQRSGLRIHRRKPESAVPFNVPAADAADQLHNELVTWVRHLHKHRKVPYTGRRDTNTLARWLSTNLTELALTPGSQTAATDITARVDTCTRLIDLPPDDDVVIDHRRIHDANRAIITANTITTIATRLGPIGAGLNRDRLRLLARRGDIKPCSTDPDTGTRFYRLGDVLHAHHARTRRATNP